MCHFNCFSLYRFQRPTMPLHKIIMNIKTEPTTVTMTLTTHAKIKIEPNELTQTPA